MPPGILAATPEDAVRHGSWKLEAGCHTGKALVAA